MRVSLLEYFLHPLGPLVLVYSFPIEKSSEGFFVRESTAKSGLIGKSSFVSFICCFSVFWSWPPVFVRCFDLYLHIEKCKSKKGWWNAAFCSLHTAVAPYADLLNSHSRWHFAHASLLLFSFLFFHSCYSPPLKINTVSNYLSCQAALSALAAHAIEPGEAERQVLGIILGQGQQMTDAFLSTTTSKLVVVLQFFGWMFYLAFSYSRMITYNGLLKVRDLVSPRKWQSSLLGEFLVPLCRV